MRSLTLSIAVAVVALLCASTVASATVSQQQAERKALSALGARTGTEPLVVFRSLSALEPGTRVTAAGLPRLAPVAASSARSRADLLRAAGVTIVQAPLVARVGGEPAWFFYADQAPYQAYQHPGRVVLVGQRSGRVTLSSTIDWPPLIDGRLPYFLRSFTGYRNPRTRAFTRLWRPAAKRAAARAVGDALGTAAALPIPTPLERQVAAQLAAERSCAVRVGDTLGNFYDASSFDQTRSSVGAFFNRLAAIDAGFLSVRYRVRTGMTLPRFVAHLVGERGCRDVFLYVAGGGYVNGGEPAVSVGIQSRPDGRVEQQVVTAGTLRAILRAHPGVTFKLQLDAPGSGAFLAPLRSEPNLLVLLASSRTGESAFTALPDLVAADGRPLPNAYNASGLMEFSNRGLRGLECFAASAAEIDAAARAKAEGRTRSFLAWMLRRAYSLCGEGSLAEVVRDSPAPVLRTFGFVADPTPPAPGSPTPAPLPPGPKNAGPTAVGVSATTAEDTPVELTLAGADPEGDALTYAVAAQPAGGTVSGGTGAARTFTPGRDVNGTVTFAYTVSDGRASATATVTVTVTPVDDAPTLAVGDGTTSFVEDGPPVAVAPALTLADADGDPVDGASVAVTPGFASGEDELLFSDQSGISGAWDGATGVLRLTGRASVAAYEAALRSIAFRNTSQGPSTAPRGIRFVVTAAGADSAPASRALTVTDTNEAPVLTGAGGGPLRFTEGDTATAVFGSIAIADADDARLLSATVTVSGGFAAGEDELLFADQNGIAGAWNGVTGELRLSGDASLADYATALRTVRYLNDSDDPSTAPRTVSIRVADAGATSNTLTRSVEVEAVTDAPVLTAGGATAAYSEGDATGVAVDPGLVVADPDSARLASATVTIATGLDPSADELLVDPSPAFTIAYDGASGTLTITGSATVADYQSLLRSVRYRNNDGENPDTTTRVVDFAVSDGTLASNAASASVSVARVNDAPELGGGGNTLAVTEGDAAAVLNGALTVSDVDDADLDGATIAIGAGFAAGEDELLFADQNGIAGTWNGSTGVLTLTGASSVANYQAAVRSVQFRTDGNDPSTADRTVAYRASDGDDESAAIATTVTVAAVNDAPALGGGGSTVTFTEDDATGVVVAAALTASDPDDDRLASATVSVSGGFAAAEDELLFTGQNGIAGAWNGATGELTLTGGATVAEYQAALRSIRYRNVDTASPSTADRTISFQTSDGALSSNTATATVSVVAVNDAATLAGSGATVTFREVEGTPVVLDGTLTIADVDDVNLESATVAISGGFLSGEDELTFSDSRVIASDWDALTGVLRLTGSATLAHYQSVLRTVQYRNTSSDPSTAARTVTFTVGDGDDESAGLDVDVAVEAYDDGLAVTASPGTAMWGGADVAVDPALTLSDPDTPDVTGATVQITGGYEAGEDLLAFTDTPAITASFDAIAGTLTLSGTAPLADYQAALRAVRYQHAGSTFTAAPRTITFTATNAAGSDAATKQLTLGGAPEVASPGAPLAYTENDAATAIDPTLTVTDPDSADLTGATVEIATGFASGEDELSATTSGTAITAAYAAGTLTLSGTDTVANYQRVLRTAAYRNSSDAPSTTARSIRFTVTDGTLSVSAANTVTVSAVNDAPGLVAGGGSPTFTEDGAAVAVDPAVVVSDVDDAQLGSATVAIGSGFALGEDVLDFTDQNGIFGSYSAATGVLTLTGASSVANYQAALRSVRYRNGNTLNPSTADRTISFTVRDGLADSAAADTTVTVTPVNDAPRIVSGATLAYTENDGATPIDPALTLSDGDSATLTSATVAIGAGYALGEDVLTFVNTVNITGSFNSSTGTLTLTGPATVAAFETALRAVRYSNGSEDPSSGPRTVTFTVDDAGAVDSTASATATVTVTPVNDAPTVAGETSTAVGNTRLAYGTTVPAGEAGRAIMGSVLTNDTDVDSSGPLAVNPATSSTASVNGGSVAWNADGSFSYVPPSSFTGSDTLTYRVTDQETPAAEAAGSVVVTVARRVWYVDNEALAGGTGRSSDPFDTLAEADAAATSADDTIYAFGGDGTATGMTGGVTLLARQRLIGATKDLVVNAEPLHVGTPTGRPTIAGTVDLASGNTVTGLTLDASAAGVAAIGGAAGDSDGTIRDVAITAGSRPGLSLSGTSGSWTVDDLAVTTTGGDGIAISDAGTVDFRASGSVTVEAGGTGNALTIARTALSGQVDSVTTANASGPAVSLIGTTGSLTLDDLDLTASGAGLVLDSSDGVVVNGSGDARVTAGGTAVEIATTLSTPANPPQVTLLRATSTGGTNGISVSGTGATRVAIPAGALSGHTDAALSIDGGSGDISYGGTIGNGSGLSARIQNRTGGAVAVSGAINDGSDAGGGISATGNAGGSIAFGGATKRLTTGAQPAVFASLSGAAELTFPNGGLDIDTTSGAGFSVTGTSATGKVVVGGSNNTVDSLTGTPLTISAVPIGADDVTFASIASNGAPSGIVLSGTGNAGGLRVTGSGTDGSGGTIQASTGAGVLLTNAADVQLTSVVVRNGLDDGIRGSGVDGFSLLGRSQVTGNGDAVGEHGIEFAGLVGAAAMTDANVSANADRNVEVVNDSGALVAAIRGGTYSDTRNVDGVGSDGIYVEGTGTGSMAVTIDGARFTNNRDDHVQVTTDSTTTAELTVSILDTTMTNTVGDSGGGIMLNPGGRARLIATVRDNTIVGARTEAVTVDAPGSSSDPQQVDIGATIENNAIGRSGVASSGSSSGNAIGVRSNGSSAVRVKIAGNVIREYANAAGIFLANNDGDVRTTLDATVQGNVIADPAVAGGLYGLSLTAGGGGADAGITCLVLGSATIPARENLIWPAGGAGGDDVRIRHRDGAAVKLPGYAGGVYDTAAVASFVAAANDSGSVPTVAALTTGTGPGFTDTAGSAPCA